MAFAPSSPVTGATMAGLTSPTMTLTADTAPDINGKQYAVTALGGTQTGVLAHSIAAPYTGTFTRPKILRALPRVNQLTGALGSVPRNTFVLLTRKGVLPLAGQAYQTMLIRTYIECPAGADLADPLSVRSALSFHGGLLWAAASGMGDTVVTGVL